MTDLVALPASAGSTNAVAARNQRIVRGHHKGIPHDQRAIDRSASEQYIVRRRTGAAQQVQRCRRANEGLEGYLMSTDLSFRLIRLWQDYCSEYRRVLSAKLTFGHNSPATVMRESIAKSTLEDYFAELEKHVDHEPFVSWSTPGAR